MIPDRVAPRTLAAVRDGLGVVLAGLGSAFVLTGVASLAYRPRGHTGSALDWLRIAGYLVAMSVGAPLRLAQGADQGDLRIVPLTVTAVLVIAAARRGRGKDLAGAVCAAVTAAAGIGLVALLTGSRLPSYDRHSQLHFSVPVLPSALGAAVVVGLSYAAAAISTRSDSGWLRATAAAVRAAGVVGAVSAVTAIGAALWWGHFPVRALGAVPALLGDGSSWLGGFSLGGQITANLSSPIPFLSIDDNVGLISGGAAPLAYLLLLVPAVAAVAAGRRQQRAAPQDVREWAEFGRAAVCNGLLWLAVAEVTRLRFAGRISAGALSGSAGLDPLTTAFVAALWGGVGAVVGLALGPVPLRRRWSRSSR